MHACISFAAFVAAPLQGVALPSLCSGLMASTRPVPSGRVLSAGAVWQAWPALRGFVGCFWPVVIGCRGAVSSRCGLSLQHFSFPPEFSLWGSVPVPALV